MYLPGGWSNPSRYYSGTGNKETVSYCSFPEGPRLWAIPIQPAQLNCSLPLTHLDNSKLGVSWQSERPIWLQQQRSHCESRFANLILRKKWDKFTGFHERWLRTEWKQNASWKKLQPLFIFPFLYMVWKCSNFWSEGTFFIKNLAIVDYYLYWMEQAIT